MASKSGKPLLPKACGMGGARKGALTGTREGSGMEKAPDGSCGLL